MSDNAKKEVKKGCQQSANQKFMRGCKPKDIIFEAVYCPLEERTGGRIMPQGYLQDSRIYL